MKRTKIVVSCLLISMVMMGMFAVSAALAEEKTRVFLVPKFTGFIFFELARDGAQQACDELGAEMTYIGTTTADIEGQVQVFQNLVPQKPDVIVTASLDINAPVPALKRMRQKGTVVVTFDADVAPAGRDLFINMAPFEVQAKAMLESALYSNPDGGKVIWLAPHPTTANFISQKKAIDELVAGNPRYGVFDFIDTLYMEDDPEKSYQVATSAMQAHPDLAGFISGSGMANPAVNKAIQDTGRIGEVYSTGFALPSTMKTFLDDGVSKQYALWSPYWFGYMATYLGIKAKRGELEIKDGVEVDIPNVGKRLIYDTPTGISADLNMMTFFRKGNDSFETGLLMDETLKKEGIE